MTDTIAKTANPGLKALPALSDIAAEAGTEDALPECTASRPRHAKRRHRSSWT